MHTPLIAGAGLALSALLTTTLTAPAALAEPQPLDRTPERAASAGSVSLSAVGTHVTDVFDASAAEVVEHDPSTQRLFVVNAQSGAVDVLDARDPAAPTRVRSLSARGLTAADGSTVDPAAVVNSVSVHDGVLAVAVQAGDKVQRGWVAFFRTAGDVPFVSAVRVGSLPDMLTHTPDGRTVVVADEGEPAGDFSSDPEGSVSLVDVSAGVAGLAQSAVRTARFGAFEGAGLPAGVRVFGPDVAVPAGLPAAGRVARNLEPEYVTVDHDSRTAYVTLQEANSLAVVDLQAGRVTRLLPLGLKDWSATATAGLDASDQDGAARLVRWPVSGLYSPDAISSYRFRGQTFLVTANEGDAREWGTYADVVRLGNSRYPLCADVFPNAAELKATANLGRLNVSLEDGRRGPTGCFERIHTLGGRSMSIWTTDGRLVHDSGSGLEQLVASGAGGVPAKGFGANHTSNSAFDSRSDDKGPEPEGVTIGAVGGRTYAFLALERVGGVVTFDVTDPRTVTVADYVNARGWDAPVPSRAARDLGAEGVAFVAGDDSPTGRPLVVTANEVSGTTTLFAVDRVAARTR